jgi:hypothetical protein
MIFGTSRRLFLRMGLCAALVSGLLAAGGPAALADCAETIWVDVYDVAVEAERDTYRRGDTAVLHAAVVNRETGAPVEGATFAAYVTNPRRGWIFGGGETDLEGRAIARLKLKKSYVRKGPAEVHAIAFKESVDATCARVVEFGEQHLEEAFVVKR